MVFKKNPIRWPLSKLSTVLHSHWKPFNLANKPWSQVLVCSEARARQTPPCSRHFRDPRAVRLVWSVTGKGSEVCPFGGTKLTVSIVLPSPPTPLPGSRDLRTPGSKVAEPLQQSLLAKLPQTCNISKKQPLFPGVCSAPGISESVCCGGCHYLIGHLAQIRHTCTHSTCVSVTSHAPGVLLPGDPHVSCPTWDALFPDE